MDTLVYGLMIVLLGGIAYISYMDAKQVEEPFANLPDMKAFVINMDKNLYKWTLLKETYPFTDLQKIPMERYSAVVGKEVDIHQWLNENGKRELIEVEENGYRTRHYQLTRGAIGCFLSHYQLAKKLLNDPDHEIYLILEDDAGIRKETLREIQEVLDIAPPDWDILLLGYHRVNGLPLNSFTKVTGFWGTFGYLINKKGAALFVAEVEATKIDAQIDAYLSWMSQIGKMNIYATKKDVIYDNNITNHSDIQLRLVPKNGIDPYMYKGFKV